MDVLAVIDGLAGLGVGGFAVHDDVGIEGARGVVDLAGEPLGTGQVGNDEAVVGFQHVGVVGGEGGPVGLLDVVVGVVVSVPGGLVVGERREEARGDFPGADGGAHEVKLAVPEHFEIFVVEGDGGSRPVFAPPCLVLLERLGGVGSEGLGARGPSLLRGGCRTRGR